METTVSEQFSDQSLRLRLPAMMHITRINAKAVRSSKAVVTICKIGVNEIEFESNLQFPVHARVVCRIVIPLPAGDFELEAGLMEGSTLHKGKFRYLAKPHLNDFSKAQWIQAIQESASRYELFFQAAHQAYKLSDQLEQPAMSLNTTA